MATVPVPQVNVPLFAKSPDIVSVPLPPFNILLVLFVKDPPTVVVVVSLPTLNVPLLVIAPVTVTLNVSAANEAPVLTVTLVLVFILPPNATAVAVLPVPIVIDAYVLLSPGANETGPAYVNDTGLSFAVYVPAETESPLKMIAAVAELPFNVPPVPVNLPLKVIPDEPLVMVPVLVTVSVVASPNVVVPKPQVTVPLFVVLPVTLKVPEPQVIVPLFESVTVLNALLFVAKSSVLFVPTVTVPVEENAPLTVTVLLPEASAVTVTEGSNTSAVVKVCAIPLSAVKVSGVIEEGALVRMRFAFLITSSTDVLPATVLLNVMFCAVVPDTAVSVVVAPSVTAPVYVCAPVVVIAPPFMVAVLLTVSNESGVVSPTVFSNTVLPIIESSFAPFRVPLNVTVSLPLFADRVCAVVAFRVTALLYIWAPVVVTLPARVIALCISSESHEAPAASVKFESAYSTTAPPLVIVTPPVNVFEALFSVSAFPVPVAIVVVPEAFSSELIVPAAFDGN